MNQSHSKKIELLLVETSIVKEGILVMHARTTFILDKQVGNQLPVLYLINHPTLIFDFHVLKASMPNKHTQNTQQRLLRRRRRNLPHLLNCGKLKLPQLKLPALVSQQLFCLIISQIPHHFLSLIDTPTFFLLLKILLQRHLKAFLRLSRFLLDLLNVLFNVHFDLLDFSLFDEILIIIICPSHSILKLRLYKGSYTELINSRIIHKK